MRIEGHTWEEIAERLEISINTVKTQRLAAINSSVKVGDSFIHNSFLFSKIKNILILLCLFID